MQPASHTGLAEFPLSPFDADTGNFYEDSDLPVLEVADPILSELLVEPHDPESFDEAVQMGMHEAKQRSARTWRLGWLALKVPTEYGKKTLAVWASQIGISASSANKARWLAKGFPPSLVRKYFELSVEHFTVVRGLLPKEVDPEDPKYAEAYATVEDFLKDAAICGWSVNELIEQVHPDRDKNSSGFSLSGEVTGVEDGNGGVIGIYIDGLENYNAWVEQLSSKGSLGLYMNAFFKEDDRE